MVIVFVKLLEEVYHSKVVVQHVGFEDGHWVVLEESVKIRQFTILCAR